MPTGARERTGATDRPARGRVVARWGERVGAWVLGLGMLGIVIAVLLPYRARLDQVDAVLPLLVVVLVGSAGGGRALGFTLAVLGFTAIDYFFQPPFDKLAVNKGHDWLVLGAFLTVAGIATHLLARARTEAAAARRRTAEVQRLAELGAETLAAGRADEALHAIAAVIARNLDLRRCDVFVAGDDDAVRWATGVTRTGGVAEPASADEARDAAAALRDGTPPADGRTILDLPLQSHRRNVGVLRLVDDRGLALDASQRTFLAALTQYAALAAERVQLLADAEHAAALREADRLKDLVLVTVSHDLRTPLTTIKALAHAAAARGDPDAMAIEEQADRLTRMVADVLDLSRARSGTIPLTLEINTADDLVGAVVRQTRALFATRRLERRLDGACGVLAGRFDFVASLRALGNLVENAVKYSRADQAVELHVRRDASQLLFAVSDRGPGVPAAERARIFAPFYRAANAPADVGGAGLGLAVANALAAAQGGSLDHQPRVGGGSVFTLRLPAVDVDASALDAELDEPTTGAGDFVAS